MVVNDFYVESGFSINRGKIGIQLTKSLGATASFLQEDFISGSVSNKGRYEGSGWKNSCSPDGKEYTFPTTYNYNGSGYFMGYGYGYNIYSNVQVAYGSAYYGNFGVSYNYLQGSSIATFSVYSNWQQINGYYDFKTKQFGTYSYPIKGQVEMVREIIDRPNYSKGTNDFIKQNYSNTKQSAGGGTNNSNQNLQQNLETAGEVANYTDLTNSVWGSGLAAIGKNWNQAIKVGGYGIAAGSFGIQVAQTFSNPQGVSYRDATKLGVQGVITGVSFINLYGAPVGIPAAILLQGLNYEYGNSLYNLIPDTKFKLK